MFSLKPVFDESEKESVQRGRGEKGHESTRGLPRTTTVKIFDRAVASVVESVIFDHDLDVLAPNGIMENPDYPIKQSHDEKVEGKGNDD